jgi:hypothetical protein
MRCPDCGDDKPLEEFPHHRSTPLGRATYCKPCHNKRNRESRARNGGNRHYHLKQRYGIDAADVERMVGEQGGLCAVCRRRPPAQVDHDHATDRVRGILCDGCNGGIGHFRDDADLIRKAIVYVKRYR